MLFVVDSAGPLHDRIGSEVSASLKNGQIAFEAWHNGAHVLESLPTAVWCFLTSPEDFEATLFTAVDAGHDANTVVAMPCSVSGAYHGLSRLPPRLLEDLEFRDHLIELPDGLHDPALKLHGAD
jgi:ADP-ribosylglycohydrolase